jgi:hypothetical protein
MQAITYFALTFLKMAPQYEPTTKVMELTPRVPNINVPLSPSPRVQAKQPNSPISIAAFPDMSHRSPRQHQPDIISQEERAYQLLERPLLRIERAFAITHQLTGQQQGNRHLSKQAYLCPVWERAFTNKLG